MCIKLLCRSSSVVCHRSYNIVRNESCINSDVTSRLEKAFILYCGDKIAGFLVVSCINTKYTFVLIEALLTDLFLQLDDLKAQKCRQHLEKKKKKDIILKIEVCLFLLGLHLGYREYWCAQVEGGDSCVIFSVCICMFLCECMLQIYQTRNA